MISTRDQKLVDAAGGGQAHLVRRLLRKGADPNAVDSWSRTPLQCALSQGHSHIVRILFDAGAILFDGGDYVNAMDNDHRTRLHHASIKGHDNIARVCIDKGFDVNGVDKDTCTPLHYASLEGHDNIAKILIDGGADVNAVTNGGWTPLYCASSEGHGNIVRILIDRGAKVNAVINGWTPLLHACDKGHDNVARMLIDLGANVKFSCSMGWTPLHYASLDGHDNMARMLIDGGAKVNAVTKHGDTLLHHASSNGHDNIVRILIDEGANIHAVDKDGHTPLDVAGRYNRRNKEAVVTLLKDVQRAIQSLIRDCEDDRFDFKNYFSSSRGSSGWHLTKKAVEVSDELRESRAYKRYTLRKAEKRLKSQRINLFVGSHTLPPLPKDIEVPIRALAVVRTDMRASQIPDCIPEPQDGGTTR